MDDNAIDADDEEMSDAEDGADEDEDADEEDDGEDEAESSDDEVEEDEEDLPPVDPAFRRKVAAALKSAGVGIDEGDAEDGDEDEEEDDEDSDGDVWDDEQMDKVDEQLAAVFKERATMDKKTSSKRELFLPYGGLQLIPQACSWNLCISKPAS